MTSLRHPALGHARAVLVALAAAVTLSDTAPGVTGPWAVHDEARARLVAAVGGLGLELELQPGWHVYWKNSGDAGYAPRIDFSATPGIRNTRLLFPAPQRFDLPGGLVSFGYADWVLYPIAATLATSGAKPIDLCARLDYLVCRNECIPYTDRLQLEFPPQGGAADADESRLAAALAALPQDPATIPDAPQVALRVDPAPAGGFTLEWVATGGALRLAGPALFFDTHPLFAFDRPALSAAAAGLRFRIPFRPLDETKPVPATTTIAWTLTGLERYSGSGSSPTAVALAGAATIDLPLRRTSAASSAAASAVGLGIAAGTGVLALALFSLYRFRRSF